MVSTKEFGIPLLDEHLGGGLDRNTLTTIAGTLGTGKTILSSHWIAEGAKKGEVCVYVSTRMPITTIENYLGNLSFMLDVFDRIYWRVVEVDARQIMPLTREKIIEWLEGLIGFELEKVDRLVFDVVTSIYRALGDVVLYRRALKNLETVLYKNDITTIFVEEADTIRDASITIGASSCALYLGYIYTQIGETRAMKIVKRYRKTHPLNWIPYEITENGIRIKSSLCIPKDHNYILIGEEYGHRSG